MTDLAAAFLRDIIAHPADDAPRLIFADWLQEHGDEARAEFIRVQVELARREPAYLAAKARTEGNGGGYYDTGWDLLRRRERELLEAHFVDWLGELPDGLRCAALVGRPTLAPLVSFRRGFAHQWQGTWADWCGAECPTCHGSGSRGGNIRGCVRCHNTGRTGGHGPALVRAAPLERVTLSDVQPADSGEDNEDIGGRWFWRCESLPGLTSSLFDLHYPTRQAALDALSDTLLAEAKSA